MSKKIKTVIVSYDMVTSYGWGVDACWEGILSGKTAISKINRFNTSSFQSNYAAIISGLKYHEEESLIMQMLKELFNRTNVYIPADAKLIFATIKGEVDLLEKMILNGSNDTSNCTLDSLLKKIYKLSGIKNSAMVISTACASSTAAIARASAMIKNGSADCILVVASDSVTEFLFSGFSALMALDEYSAKPFDMNRKGLSIGEAASYVLLMSEERAKKENLNISGTIVGWGLSDDANHMTRPDPESNGRKIAIKKALEIADINETDISFIGAHGTGTIHNDSMEIKAFSTIFKKPRPVYSIKGAIGHTMGAAGIVEMIIALKALDKKNVPPTVNLKEVDTEAKDWVYLNEIPLSDEKNLALITNAGFGGTNAALILSRDL